MDTHSNSGSVYSLDSLDDESNDKYKTNVNASTTNTSVVKCNDTTVPYYKGEILVENVKLNTTSISDISPKRSRSQARKHPNLFKEKTNTNIDDRATSYFWNNTPSKQKACEQRMSRRKEIIAQNTNSLKTRHRSVSYLEQFRKKNVAGKSLDASSCLTTGPELLNRNKSLSFISCLSGGSRMSVSEVDFYDELTQSPKDEQLSWNEESLHSSTLLSEKSDKSSNSNKHTRQRKGKPIILSRIEVMLPEHQKTELDKKRSIEKREIYANKVKLRNQIKINRQKERDKNEKFHNPNIPLDSTTEECFIQPEIKHVCCIMSDRKIPVFHPPSVAIQGRNSKNERKTHANEQMQKNKRRGIQQSYSKKNKKPSELLTLQERHEREKSLIESMRNLILKT